jgi:hypothetical protein
LDSILHLEAAWPSLFFAVQAHLTSLQWAHLLELNFNAFGEAQLLVLLHRPEHIFFDRGNFQG